MAPENLSFFPRKTDVEWGNFAKLEGTIADSIGFYNAIYGLRSTLWPKLKSEAESKVREGQRKTG